MLATNYQCPICNENNKYKGKAISSPTKIIHQCKFCKTVFLLNCEIKLIINNIEIVTNPKKIKDYHEILNFKKETQYE